MTDTAKATAASTANKADISRDTVLSRDNFEFEARMETNISKDNNVLATSNSNSKQDPKHPVKLLLLLSSRVTVLQPPQPTNPNPPSREKAGPRF